MSKQPKVEKCDKPQPKRYRCTRERGHEGPCALERTGWGKFLDGLGEALGEAMFGGHR